MKFLSEALIGLLLCACATVPVHRTGPLSPQAKIFLVAGSNDLASFMQGIVDQKRIWLAKGYQESEISCYYSIPDLTALDEYRSEFDRLSTDLAKCYPSSMFLLRRHLLETAKRKVPFVYLYVMGHGYNNPAEVLKEFEGVKRSDLSDTARNDYDALREQEDRHLDIDEPFVDMNGFSTGEAMFPGQVVWQYSIGKGAKSMLLTPSGLLSILSAFPPTVPKFVVVEACHSGSFLAEERGSRSFKAKLSSIKHLTVMTSANALRLSHASENQGGNFGRLYNDLLTQVPKDPLRIPWGGMFMCIKKWVEEIDRSIGVFPSAPQFFSNLPGQGKADKTICNEK